MLFLKKAIAFHYFAVKHDHLGRQYLMDASSN